MLCINVLRFSNQAPCCLKSLTANYRRISWPLTAASRPTSFVPLFYRARRSFMGSTIAKMRKNAAPIIYSHGQQTYLLRMGKGSSITWLTPLTQRDPLPLLVMRYSADITALCAIIVHITERGTQWNLNWFQTDCNGLMRKSQGSHKPSFSASGAFSVGVDQTIVWLFQPLSILTQLLNSIF